jgi:hypothetical protein
VVVVVGAEVVLVVELARVAFVAYCAVEEADCCWEGVVSLCVMLTDAWGGVIRMNAYWRHVRVYILSVTVLGCVDSLLYHQFQQFGKRVVRLWGYEVAGS